MTDNRTTELLPCPFCGGEAQVMCMDLGDIEDGWKVWGVWCVDDLNAEGYRSHGHFIDNYATEEEAIAEWNTRTATTDAEFARAVHDGNLWRRVKGHIRCRNCGLNIESVIALDGCNEHAIKHCPNCGHKVVG